MLRRVDEERGIMSIINRRQGVCLGHTLGHGDIIEGSIIGRGKLEDLELEC